MARKNPERITSSSDRPAGLPGNTPEALPTAAPATTQVQVSTPSRPTARLPRRVAGGSPPTTNLAPLRA
jgi:hypothetical protein